MLAKYFSQTFSNSLEVSQKEVDELSDGLKRLNEECMQSNVLYKSLITDVREFMIRRKITFGDDSEENRKLIPKDFEVEVDGVPKFLKSIPFPAACPIFQTLPVPSLVIRGGGELSATLTFPSMGFGVKQVYVIDTAAPLPLQYYMTRNASNQEATPDVINTAEADITLKGFLQTALKLSANIETCSWFEDLLFCRLGVDFFIGPKVEGQIKLIEIAHGG